MCMSVKITQQKMHYKQVCVDVFLTEQNQAKQRLHRTKCHRILLLFMQNQICSWSLWIIQTFITGFGHFVKSLLNGIIVLLFTRQTSNLNVSIQKWVKFFQMCFDLKIQKRIKDKKFSFKKLESNKWPILL